MRERNFLWRPVFCIIWKQFGAAISLYDHLHLAKVWLPKTGPTVVATNTNAINVCDVTLWVGLSVFTNARTETVFWCELLWSWPSDMYKISTRSWTSVCIYIYIYGCVWLAPFSEFWQWFLTEWFWYSWLWPLSCTRYFARMAESSPQAFLTWSLQHAEA